ncbi:SGNH/GDSL hydrolase family protein [Microbacterium immunditiarum]|uniref:Lysophospholipase L1-like esterase n=1 Tax=Microbacterium immunditiarum TaxID=337480 RepID=A0A7Y9GTY5_9MICO|nr:SGNH/GDSL hydrolase family protein [Microbacterium immunditiarum]NYE21590.1 lysophospholipase L1-like esterase [Microbacterium immunditiarum]
MTSTIVHPHDPALTWSGALGVEHTDEWSQAWRLPVDSLDLFPDALLVPAAMSAGVRIEFDSDSRLIAGRVADRDLSPDLAGIDLVVDGVFIETTRVAEDGRFAFGELPYGEKSIELWLPQFDVFRLAHLELSPGATIGVTPAGDLPQLLTYGSSITQCRQATSPTRTWPAAVAQRLGYELTCLGFAGQCHLDPMVARVIRDRSADFIVLCIGINIYGDGSFTRRSFAPAIQGFLATVRDGHPTTPILVMSPIHSPSRETVAGAAGMTLAEMRGEVGRAVSLAQRFGAENLHYVDGLTVFGAEDADLLPDGIHPSAQGYQVMAERISAEVSRIRSLVTEADAAPAAAEGAAIHFPFRHVTDGESLELVVEPTVGILVSSVRLAADGSGDIVVLLREPAGTPIAGALHVRFPVASVHEATFHEEPTRNVAIVGGAVPVTLRPFEVSMLRLTPDQQHRT